MEGSIEIVVDEFPIVEFSYLRKMISLNKELILKEKLTKRLDEFFTIKVSSMCKPFSISDLVYFTPMKYSFSDQIMIILPPFIKKDAIKRIFRFICWEVSAELLLLCPKSSVPLFYDFSPFSLLDTLDFSWDQDNISYGGANFEKSEYSAIKIR